MGTVSRDKATVNDFEIVEERRGDLEDGYTASFITFRVEMDNAPMLKGLPDDLCQCPHWGYVFKGRVTYSFADHVEVHEAGDAFYVPPGHSPLIAEGTEFLQFSPIKELAITDEAIMRNFQAMQAAAK